MIHNLQGLQPPYLHQDGIYARRNHVAAHSRSHRQQLYVSHTKERRLCNLHTPVNAAKELWTVRLHTPTTTLGAPEQLALGLMPHIGEGGQAQSTAHLHHRSHTQHMLMLLQTASTHPKHQLVYMSTTLLHAVRMHSVHFKCCQGPVLLTDCTCSTRRRW
jgi:hypothetical protein